MRSIQTSLAFPLSSVKPLEGLRQYRDFCLGATRRVQQTAVRHRARCAACESPLEALGDVEGLDYLRCPTCSSTVLAGLPASDEWARLLAEVSRHRHSPQAFHASIVNSRIENVYAPKLEWIHSSLRLHGVRQPRLMEVATLPSEFSPLLVKSGNFEDVLTVDEMVLAHDAGAAGIPSEAQGRRNGRDDRVRVAVLLESLDRVDDPAALLRAVAGRLSEGGLIFITALVWSGFDMAVLGLRSLYLYPPDRTNCFSLQGLEMLCDQAGFTLAEVSTPGVLDVEIVQAHVQDDPSLPLSVFERRLLEADGETKEAFQSFLQEQRMSSFARVVGRKR